MGASTTTMEHFSTADWLDDDGATDESYAFNGISLWHDTEDDDVFNPPEFNEVQGQPAPLWDGVTR